MGTGFSYVNTNAYTTSLPQAADEVLYFLKQFVEVYPEYSRDVEVKFGNQGSGVDVFLAGESFAGQYIPYTAKAIIGDQNPPVALKGIAIAMALSIPRTSTAPNSKQWWKKIWTTIRRLQTRSQDRRSLPQRA